MGTSLLDRILPARACNDYRGSRFALLVFGFLSIVMMGRSLIHMLKDDAGANSIATMITFSGTPDPDNAIYMFASLWGLEQAIMALVYFIVLARYRNLAPLMYITLLIEWGGRILMGRFIHPLGDAYFVGTAPGKAGAIPSLILISVMLVLSLRASKGSQGEPALSPQSS